MEIARRNSDTNNNEVGSTDGVNSTKERTRDDGFIHRESYKILYLRGAVVVILLAAASGIVSVVAYVTSRAQRTEMDLQYNGVSRFLGDRFIAIAEVNMEAIGSLVVAVVDQGISSQKGWPFVALSSFQRRATVAKDLSGALYIGLNPVVRNDDRQEWELYSTEGQDSIWYQESVAAQETLGIMDLDNRPQVTTDDPNLNLTGGIANRIYDLQRVEGAKAYISPTENFYLPIWQTSPVTRRTMINQNRASNSEGALRCLEEHSVVFEGMQYSRPGFGDDIDPYTAEIAWLLRLANKKRTRYEGDIFSTVFFPVHDSFADDREAVAVIRVIIHWARFLKNLLPETIKGIIVVLDNNCDEPYTYEINGGDVLPIGHGDLHDPEFDDSMVLSTFKDVKTIPDGTTAGMRLGDDECPYSIRIYKSKKFRSLFISSEPIIITISVAFVFIFTIGMFFVYDRLVERRQKLLVTKAQQTGSIVSSLFPAAIRDRLIQAEGASVEKIDQNDSAAAPIIADLFPQTTVFFCDIVGFTSWSSSRGPEQVFTLLQTIYQAFDKIAKRMGVFKVETIGDSYVAVTGCPEAQHNHAVLMAGFAFECSQKLKEILLHLVTTLGPDTADLGMRFGIHSGPVTAGVLKGDRSRFQLFGDTVNMAARMESTGKRGRIQVSQATASLLIECGKGQWVVPREDSVVVKGKGIVKTYWITPSTESLPSLSDSETIADGKALKNARSVKWMTQLLIDYAKKIHQGGHSEQQMEADISLLPVGKMPLDEVTKVITLKDFCILTNDTVKNNDFPVEIERLLYELVAQIATFYHETPFHNFEHACWVAMSADKFLKRIVSPKVDDSQLQKWASKNSAATEIASHLYDYTHGIGSALIHDMDHLGISNKQLQHENPDMAEHYAGKSIAEQNSLDLAWSVFSMDIFKKLRDFLFHTQDDLARFRQVMVNVVLATDLFDSELNDLRRNRWDEAFTCQDRNATCGLRATIVIEHIIQASDVSHTMQHWHIYQKWNYRLFCEMRLSFRDGRMGVDPVTFWYEGELKFFDNYIIPLAKKLKDCNVFGVSSDEVLNYATHNRAEWEEKGKTIVGEFVASFDKEYGAIGTS